MLVQEAPQCRPSTMDLQDRDKKQFEDSQGVNDPGPGNEDGLGLCAFENGIDTASATKEKAAFSIDSIFVALGSMGRYQMTQGFLICISNLTIAFNLFSFVFIAQPVKHQCSDSTQYIANFPVLYSNMSQNNTIYEQCSVIRLNATTNETSTSKCQAWAYTVRKDHSIVSQWDLVCDDVFFARLPQSLFIVGQAIGAVTFSALSDRFGRKTFLIVAHFLTLCAGVGLAFSPNIATFTVLRLVNGICQQGVVVTCVTLLLETFPTRIRALAGSIYYVMWSIATVFLTLSGYLVRHLVWKWQALAFMTVCLTIILQIILLKESIRWLITNKKDKQAMDIIEAAAKINGVDITTIPFKPSESTVPIPEEESLKTEYVDTATDVTVEIEAAQYKYFDLFKSRFLLKMSAVIWFSWLVDSLTYFSLYLTASSLADDLYLNFFLNSLAELPSGPLYWFIGRRWGRRRYFTIFHIVAGTGLLLATVVRGVSASQAASTAATALAFIGKIGNCACFNGMFVYSPEIYPTNLRTAGIGAGSTSARVGGCIAPFISMLALVVPWAPGTIFGVLCLVTAALNTFFPEPEGQEMPQTIEHIKQWEKSYFSKLLSKC